MKKENIILVIVIIAIVGAIVYFESQKASPILSQQAPTAQEMPTKKITQSDDIKAGMYELAPELAGIRGYLNTQEGLTLEDLRGKVVLIDFWTYTCINCIRTLPHLTSWDEKYRDKGLVIVGVHTPEFEFEKDRSNVQQAMDNYNIKYPVVQDNDYATWRAFKNRFWPRKYLIDGDGYIRYDHIGEGAYDETEQKIQELLAEIGSEVTNMSLTGLEDKTPTRRTTRELYAGYQFALPRGQNLGNANDFVRDETFSYGLPARIKSDTITLRGDWFSTSEELQAKSPGSIILNFTAHTVNIVANPLANGVMMEIEINGKPVSRQQAGEDVIFQGSKSLVIVDEAKLYNVIDGEYGNYLLELKVDEGYSFSAFTFG